MSDQDKCQGYGSIPGCGTTATWKDGKPFDVLVAVGFDEVTRTVIWACTDCIFWSGLGEPQEVPVAARCYRWLCGEKCSKPRRSETNYWKFCSDACCELIRQQVEERQEKPEHQPTKGDTAPMSQPITEQDVADYLEKFIQTSKLVPDQMKALFIGRVTNWGNPVGAHPVGQESTEKPAPTAEVARTPDTTEPLTMSITRDDDGHMCIAIADRKWKIMRHGIIGNGAADREEFHQAASDLVDNDLPFSDAGLESVVLSSQLLEMKDQSRAYRDAMKYRSAIDQTLGHVMYEAYCRALPSSEEKQKLTKWNDVVFKWAWEEAALAAYFSVGLDPDEINKEIQIIAARQRIRLLQQAYFVNGDIGERAAHINALAGPTPQPNP